MKTKKILSKALSVLLSGAMIAGMIPAVSMTAAAETTDHTPTGYICEWSEGFEKGFGTGWTSEDKDGDTYCWFVSPDKFDCGSKSMMSRSWVSLIGTLSSDNWLYSPQIQLSKDKDYKLTFNAYGLDNTFGVFIAVGQDSDKYVQLGSDYTISAEGWNEYTIDLSEYAGEYIRLAFVHHNSTGTNSLVLDCLDISSKPHGYTMNTTWGPYGFEDVVFDGASTVADVPEDFFTADKDGDGKCWVVSNSANYAHTGDCAISSSPGRYSVTMNNWLRLPKISLGNEKDYLLTFFVSNPSDAQSVDVYLFGGRCCDASGTKEDLDGDGVKRILQ